MAHYAFLNENNIVVEVITGVDENQLIEGIDPEIWYGNFKNKVCKRTSYNAQINGFRKNYAGIGYVYNEEYDAFIPPRPFDSWNLNLDTFSWDPPIPMPIDEDKWYWDEESVGWQKI